MGEKARRRSSMGRRPMGDGLGLATNPTVRGTILTKFGDARVLFSDLVLKLDRAGAAHERVLLVTERAVYNLDPGTYRLKRRIDLRNLQEIRLSTLADNFVCLMVPTEYDYMLVSNAKSEIVEILVGTVAATCRRQLLLTFANTFAYKVDDNSRRQISFKNAIGGVTTDIALIPDRTL